MATFQEIYQKYGKNVYRFLVSLTGNSQEAEELLQETFYQALLHIDRFEGRSSVYTWLCQIGKNVWLQECRRQKRFTDYSLEELEIVDSNQLPEEKAIRNLEYEKVRQAVYALEEPYRNVFIMHVFGQVALKEIAASYGKSESWARVTYYRARQKVSSEIQG